MNQFHLLQTKRFFPLFLTQFLGALNDNIYKNALVVFIAFTVADFLNINSSILVIIAGGLFILPYFLFSATAGQIADKYEKSTLIRRIKVAEIIIMIFASIGFIFQNVFVLMFVLFLMGTQSTFFGPIKYGILPQHLSEKELTGGNGLVQMGTYLAILGGTIIGGILIAEKETGMLYVSATVMLIAVSGWYTSRAIPVAESLNPTLKIDWNIARETIRVLGYAVKNREIFIAIISISWFWFVGATFLYLVPSYTRDVLMGNEYMATLLLTAFSIGIGSGSLMCEKLSRGRIEPGLVPIGAIGLTVFAVDLFFVGVPVVDGLVAGQSMGPGLFIENVGNWRILIDLIFIGLFGGIYIVPLYAMVQNRSDPDHRARVIAAVNILDALLMVISAILVTVLISMSVTIPEIFLIVGIMNALITGTIFFIFREYIQRFKQLIFP